MKFESGELSVSLELRNSKGDFMFEPCVTANNLTMFSSTMKLYSFWNELDFLCFGDLFKREFCSVRACFKNLRKIKRKSYTYLHLCCCDLAR